MGTSHGNVLFLILLAVLLFAALAYAVTSSMRGGGSDITRENAEQGVSAILNWFTNIDTAVQRMMLTGGWKDYEIDFNTPLNLRGDGVDTPDDNTNCNVPACEVFAPEGGGVAYKSFEKWRAPVPNWPDSQVKPGHSNFMVGNIEHLGTTLNDVVIRIRALNPELCKALRRRMGENENFSDFGVTGSVNTYTGDSVAKLALNTGYIYTGESLRGRQLFCNISTNYDGYADFYYVAIPR